MRTEGSISAERNALSAALPGVFLAMLAVAGLDAGLGGGFRLERHHRLDVSGAALVCSFAGSPAASPALAGMVGAVVLLLWIGRHFRCDLCRPVTGGRGRSAFVIIPPACSGRRLSISYRLGGLYGP